MKIALALMLITTSGLVAGAYSADAQAISSIDHLWSGRNAMRDIEMLLKWSPRSIGAPGHQRAIEYIEKRLASYPDLETQKQEWTTQRDDGVTLHLTNIIGRLHPTIARRLIFVTHYDSIVVAYKDPDEHLRKQVMPGANNSASGVALLLETARILSGVKGMTIGVDFFFSDGEEGPYSLGEGDAHWHALGSPYFANSLASFYGTQPPEAAVAFDMVCKTNLKLFPEIYSIQSGKNEQHRFWEIGRNIAPKIFLDGPPIGPIGDDQVPLGQKGIPSILVIDFDYAPWFNTTKDTVDKCSSESLTAVGRTLIQYALSKKSD